MAMHSWRDDYAAALAEKDPVRQLQLIYQAILSVEQQRWNPSLSGSEETEAMEKADRALKTLRTDMTEGKRGG